MFVEYITGLCLRMLNGVCVCATVRYHELIIKKALGWPSGWVIESAGDTAHLICQHLMSYSVNNGYGRDIHISARLEARLSASLREEALYIVSLPAG